MPKNGRMKMRDIKRIIQLYNAGLSRRLIGQTLKKPKSTISDYIARFNKSGLTLNDLETKTTDQVYNALFPEESNRSKQRSGKITPDFNRIHLELKLLVSMIM